MSVRNEISFGQIEADLFVAEAAMDKSELSNSKLAKYYKGLAGYHLQQAAEKLIKYQIYASEVQLDYSRMYKHSLNELLIYAQSLGLDIDIPAWIEEKKQIISTWEARGRYDVHFVVRIDTLKKCFQEISLWKDKLRKKFK